MPMNKTEKSIGTVLLAFLAGIFYRMGGSGNWPRWVREIGVGACLIIEFLLLGVFNFGAIGTLGSIWVESTYFKKKGTDAKWWNWLLVGFSFSIAPLPWLLGQLPGVIKYHHPFHWFGYVIRIFVCAALTVLWQEVLSAKVAKVLNIGKDITDEFGRGAIQILTLPLCLI